MKKTAAVLLALFMQPGLPALNAAPVSVEFGDSVYSIDTSVVPALDAPAAMPDRGMRPAKKKKWTIMVFINGKNDLETAGLLNVNMMEMVGSDKNMNVVVELGRMKGQAGDTDADGDWTGSRRLYVTKDEDQEKITSKVVMTTPQVDMGDYQRAVDFVKWAKKFYPAERYMLVLWDHGTGWMDPRKEAPAGKSDNKGISFDDETGNYIRTPQIGAILKESGGADILAFDACLMQMAEVASEVKGYAEVMVGSEETTPGVGIPYHALLAVMAGNPGMKSEELGAVLAELFVRFYKEMGKGVQNSAIRLEKMAAFEKLMKDFAALARETGDTEALKAARAGVMRYEVLGRQGDPAKTISFYGDVYNYAEILVSSLTAAGAPAEALKAKAKELKRFIKDELVIHNNYTGADHTGRDFKDSHGISVYLPPAEALVAQAKLEGIFESGYSDFAFSKATGWHDFATFLYGVK